MSTACVLSGEDATATQRAAGHPMADAAPFLRTMAEQAAARLPGAQLAAAFELIPV